MSFSCTSVRHAKFITHTPTDSLVIPTDANRLGLQYTQYLQIKLDWNGGHFQVPVVQFEYGVGKVVYFSENLEKAESAEEVIIPYEHAQVMDQKDWETLASNIGQVLNCRVLIRWKAIGRGRDVWDLPEAIHSKGISCIQSPMLLCKAEGDVAIPAPEIHCRDQKWHILEMNPNGQLAGTAQRNGMFTGRILNET